jgi:hypothetical protein
MGKTYKDKKRFEKKGQPKDRSPKKDKSKLKKMMNDDRYYNWEVPSTSPTPRPSDADSNSSEGV